MSPEPRSIEANRAAGTITVNWADGHESVYSSQLLRWACPCAVCSGEWGRPGVLANLDALPDDEFLLTDVLSVGGYAITPVWASGHASGIYTFEYLRGLCSCASCMARSD